MYIRYSVWFQEIYILPPWKVIDKSEGGGGGEEEGVWAGVTTKVQEFQMVRTKHSWFMCWLRDSTDT